MITGKLKTHWLRIHTINETFTGSVQSNEQEKDLIHSELLKNIVRIIRDDNTPLYIVSSQITAIEVLDGDGICMK